MLSDYMCTTSKVIPKRSGGVDKGRSALEGVARETKARTAAVR